MTGEDTLYVGTDAGLLRTQDNVDTLVAEYDARRIHGPEYDRCIYNMVLGPEGALFAEGVDALVCLDADTLTERFRFGEDFFDEDGYLAGLAVFNDEVYAADSSEPCVRVFSLTGEYRREVRGAFHKITSMVCANERLYVAEYPTADEEKDPTRKCGRRILMLSPNGETLQVYQPEAWSDSDFCIRDVTQWGPNKLVVTPCPNRNTREPSILHVLVGI